MATEPRPSQEAEQLKERAHQILGSHGHTMQFRDKEDRDLTMDNCAACRLGGYNELHGPDGEPGDTGPLAPSYAGWARLFVQAGRPIPAKYREAFEDERTDAGDPEYAANLARDIKTFGVTYTN